MVVTDLEVTRCPMSKDKMTHIFVAPYTYSYERDKIGEWLAKKQISPVTGEIMGMFMLTHDHTVEKFSNQ